MHAACECVCVCIWYMCVFLHVLMCVFGCVCVCTCVCVLICKYNIKTPNQNYIPAIVDISTTSLVNLDLQTEFLEEQNIFGRVLCNYPVYKLLKSPS